MQIVAVVGLGYVGLPLAIEFGKKSIRLVLISLNIKSTVIDVSLILPVKYHPLSLRRQNS